MNRIFRNTIFYLLIFLVIIGVVSFFNTVTSLQRIYLMMLIANLENGEVTNLTMQPERGVFEVNGQLKGYADDKHFITYIPNSDSEIRHLDELCSGM